MPTIEYFYSAQSAFACLGHKRLLEIVAKAGATLLHRPMELGPVVGAAHPNGFADRSPAHRAYYFGREIERWAEYRGVPFKGGIPANHRNGTVLANSMLIAASHRDHGADALAGAFMQSHWCDYADLADEAHLLAMCAKAELDGAALLAAAGTSEVAAELQKNTDEAVKRSVFGSPTYFVDGDMFYGQDRLELVERALARPFRKVWS
ncbi:MAG: 2-hydroxychromene-2-carboxylate isomerase [Alphaproteobacteria bacterium]|nr:2-hydroxychromene-2-carboxylate isomerase [Alphaproteobacteria bacterium]